MEDVTMMRYPRDLLLLAVIISFLYPACTSVNVKDSEVGSIDITTEFSPEIKLELTELGLTKEIITTVIEEASGHLEGLGRQVSKKDRTEAVVRGLRRAESLAKKQGIEMSDKIRSFLKQGLNEVIDEVYPPGIVSDLFRTFSNHPWLWGALGVVTIGSITATATSGGGNGVQTGNVNVTVDPIQ